MTHTPGPWKVTTKFDVGPVSDADDQSYGMVIPLADVFGECREADAKLIAAAPELLKALRWMLEEFDDLTLTDDIKSQFGWSANTVKAIQMARAAVLKATA